MAVVTADRVASAQVELNAAQEALERVHGDMDAPLRGLDAHLHEIDQLTARERSARARFDRLVALQEAQREQRTARAKLERDSAPLVAELSATLTSTSADLRKAIVGAIDALTAVATAAECHDAAVTDARQCLETRGLLHDPEIESESAALGAQGCLVAGTYYSPVPVAAAMKVAFGEAARSVLPFEHVVRREYDLCSTLDVLAVKRSGLLDDLRIDGK